MIASMNGPLGKVWFVGAGPGDPGLMTVAGATALSDATVVLYDYLIHPSILNYSPNADLVVVGKSRGYHSKKQDEINSLLLKYAQDGHRVVRLKGGDPCIFGRLGEELEILIENGIPFEIIPGVTAGTAAAIYSGIPLTYREISRSVAFVTASTFSNIDQLGDLHIPIADTIVFFMPLAHLDALSARIPIVTHFTLDTPAALISDGTTQAHRHVVGTLATIGELSRQLNFRSPSLLIVGEVCRFSKTLSWFSPSGDSSPFSFRRNR
ncbi:uroporphyrinogen-III C-methyltransferase [bacterium]|nr:uroporphyrinogen-III C-methyltransferase [bacterium]